ncbi:hypothetical protein SAMN05421825_3042 [Epilithonimonas hungarica]|uniref:Uncharacterized protein n=1 Tax=Epilithonimonas hungarica TaxID=454006 RepID=A0A1G7SQJ3_9FLAO|nr:hypothetical protein SAMN05421825_3042 [Epilithonimonas hungarica]
MVKIKAGIFNEKEIEKVIEIDKRKYIILTLWEILNMIVIPN